MWPYRFFLTMNKLFLATLAGCALVSCSTMPDGISEDAVAPYTLAPRTLMCNTPRALGTAAFTPTNNCLYYEIDNKEDRNASGRYMRTSEEEATVMIFGDDVYTVEYKLKFETPSKGTVEETLNCNGETTTYNGTFIVR